MAFALTIHNGNKSMQPCVIDGVSVEWTRQGSPGKIEFTVVKDAGISFVEGNAVTLVVDGKKVFRGYVFKKSRDKEQHIQVTAYDSIVYMAKNQTRAVIDNKTASDAIRALCKDIGLADSATNFADTGYLITRRFDSQTSYLDIFQTLLDLTLAHTGKMFVLYDDFGVLTLKNIDDMRFTDRGALLVTSSNAENFDYESSIEESCNGVGVFQMKGNGDVKEFDMMAYVEDKKNKENWGTLVRLEELDSDGATKENAEMRASQILELHNQVKRRISINSVFDDPSIRAGSSVVVDLVLGDVAVKRWFMVESVKHNFANDYSTMDLSLTSGKGFIL